MVSVSVLVVVVVVVVVFVLVMVLVFVFVLVFVLVFVFCLSLCLGLLLSVFLSLVFANHNLDPNDCPILNLICAHSFFLVAVFYNANSFNPGCLLWDVSKVTSLQATFMYY